MCVGAGGGEGTWWQVQMETPRNGDSEQIQHGEEDTDVTHCLKTKWEECRGQQPFSNQDATATQPSRCWLGVTILSLAVNISPGASRPVRERSGLSPSSSGKRQSGDRSFRQLDLALSRKGSESAREGLATTPTSVLMAAPVSVRSLNVSHTAPRSRPRRFPGLRGRRSVAWHPDDVSGDFSVLPSKRNAETPSPGS